MTTINTTIGVFRGVGDKLLHEQYPVIMLAGYRTMAGDKVVHETPARVVFAGNRHEVTPDQIRAEAARLDAIRAEYNAAWAAYDTPMKAWYAGLNAHLAASVGPAPEMRPVKPGRRITRAEGRRMALNVGFDPSVHNMRYSDPADLAAAEREYEEAFRTWRAAEDKATEQYEAMHQRPSAPSVPSPACDAWIAAKHAGLFGYRV